MSTPAIDMVYDPDAPLKWFIFYESLQEHLKNLEFTCNLIVLTKFLRIKFLQLKGFLILPMENFPGKAKLSNIHQLKILMQIVNELKCCVSSTAPRLAWP